MQLKKFIKTLIRERELLIKRNLSKKNTMRCQKAIQRIRTFLEFHPTIEESKLRNYVKKNQDLIQEIMPGEGSTKKEKYNQLLNQLLWEQ